MRLAGWTIVFHGHNTLCSWLDIISILHTRYLFILFIQGAQHLALAFACLRWWLKECVYKAKEKRTFFWQDVLVKIILFRKQSERMTFSFCPDGTWSTGVKVDKDGKGLLKLWKKQLQQLNRITQPVAMAIAQAYPTPQLLQRVMAATCTYLPFVLIHIYADTFHPS